MRTSKSACNCLAHGGSECGCHRFRVLVEAELQALHGPRWKEGLSPEEVDEVCIQHFAGAAERLGNE